MRASAWIVIPAQAGIQQLQWLLDSGSPLRCGRNDDFRSQGAFFRSLSSRSVKFANFFETIPAVGD